MEVFDFFNKSKVLYNPKTPAAALKAYETGFNPIEMFIFKSGSTKPLNEEPFDIEAIERLLSRKDLDLEANMILIDIFEKLIFSADQEIALFAAESINIIETRYNSRIEQLKIILEEKDSIEVHAELGKLFFEFAMINRSREAIKKFYFKESYGYFRRVRQERKLTCNELQVLIHLLLELKLHMNALDVLEREHTEKNLSYLFLKAEIAFAMKEFSEVVKICKELAGKDYILSDEIQNSIYYWLGKA